MDAFDLYGKKIQTRRCASIACIVGNKSVVLVRHGMLGWSLPGGKLEQGETLRQAALREWSEEVGPNEGLQLGRLVTADGDVPGWQVLCFIAHVAEAPVISKPGAHLFDIHAIPVSVKTSRIWRKVWEEIKNR